MSHWERVEPDYRGRGITNLMSSIARGLGGGDTGYPALGIPHMESLSAAKNILLLVIDGLGHHYLQQHGQSALSGCCKTFLTSVFPSTTATAIPTFLTAVPPQQHGFTGWFTYFSELGSVLAVLPFSNRLGYAPVDPRVVSPMSLSGAPAFSDRVPTECVVVAPDWISDSPFNRAFRGNALSVPFSGLGGLRRRLRQSVSQKGIQRRYIYAYWGEFDALAHQFGVDSPQVQAHFLELDQLFTDLTTALAGTDTLVLVTADHGFIDCAPETTISLADHPALAETLMVPLCGEPRVAFCYVHPDRQAAFVDYVGSQFSREMELVPSIQLLDRGWFGSGIPHPRLKDRIGHYTLLMKENYVITGRLPGERPMSHIGVHGGVSRREMHVPLIVAEC